MDELSKPKLPSLEEARSLILNRRNGTCTCVLKSFASLVSLEYFGTGAPENMKWAADLACFDANAAMGAANSHYDACNMLTGECLL